MKQIPQENKGGIKIEIIMNDFSKKECYDGSQIKPLWALNKYGVSGSTVVIFRGSMKIPQEEMIDIQDIIREKDLAEILISGDDCIHFIIEMFDDQPANLKVAYHRLHLLAFIIQKIIEEEYKISLEKKGTDLYYKDKKLNVAIATSSNSSSKIHFGINIISTGVPVYVNAVGLYDINEKINLEKLAERIGKEFIAEISAINSDVMKSRTL
ncbi:MAG: DUF366 family protein [Candidatus Heimdallarchaeota archaeon]|nr:DUF366 family protein [Candidatus Heimdallarchaeota archaeon]